MEYQNFQTLRAEMNRLNQRLKLVVACWLVTLALFAIPSWVKHPLANSQSDNLRVRSIAIVDDKGTERIHIGSSISDVIVGGKRYKRRSPTTGIIINDANGNERSGYGLADDGTVNLGMDSEKSERVSLFYWPDKGAGLLVSDENGQQRAAFGILSPEGRSGMVLNDSKGVVRASLRVNPDGSPNLNINDEKGNRTFSAPEQN